MKAISIKSIGKPDVLNINDIPKPKIMENDEVLVKLKAAGVNPIDTKLRSGAYPIDNFPAVLGCDGAGIVEEIGSKVDKVKKGDSVFFFHGGIGGVQGNYAQYKVLNQDFIAHKPKSISFIEAAAVPLVSITAWEALFMHANIKKDDKLFINAGAGGVGHIAIQLAKYRQAIVHTSVSSDKKKKVVKNFGADHIFNYKKEDIKSRILKLTNNEGVDVALDNVGNHEIEDIISITKNYGHMVTLLQPNNKIDWSLARFKNLSLSFEVMLTPQLYNLKNKQIEQTRILEKITNLIDADNLKIHISEVMQLEDAAIAHKMIEDGHTTGKIVLNIE